MKVKSSLGEPLKVEIELLESTPDEMESVTGSLGSKEDYETVGLEDSIPSSNLRVNVSKRDDGRRVVLVTSDSAINDPFLELLIKIQSSTSNIMRQYTVLLDPPTSAIKEDVQEEASPVGEETPKAKPTKNAANKSEMQVSAHSKPVIPHQNNKNHSISKKDTFDSETIKNDSSGLNVSLSSDTYTTKRGDVFCNLARHYRPVGIDLNKVMAALYAANKDAFIHGDIGKLKSGYTLKIPTQDSLSGLNSPNNSQAEAQAGNEKQTNPTQNQAEKKPSYVLKISPGESSQTDDSQQSASTAPNPTPSPATSENDSQNANSTSETSPVSAQPAGTSPSQQTTTNTDQAPVKTQTDSAAVKSVVTTQPQTTASPSNITQKQTSFLDGLLSNWYWIVIGLMTIVGIVTLFVFRKRRQNEFNDIVNVDDTVDDAPPKFNIENTSAQPKEEQAANVSTLNIKNEQIENANRETSTHIDIHEVDPLVEAEIYMSYGRHEQAEGILNNALIVTPYQHELSMGLLKIYADRKDLESFQRVAQKIYEDAKKGNLEDTLLWGKVASLGEKLDPDNKLYKIEKLGDKDAYEASLSEQKDSNKETTQVVSDEPTQAPKTDRTKTADKPPLDFDLSLLDVEATPTNPTATEEVAEELNLTSPEKQIKTTAKRSRRKEVNKELDLNEPTQAAPTDENGKTDDSGKTLGMQEIFTKLRD